MAELATQFPPRWQHRNKVAVAEIATPPDAIHEGEITASRWRGGRIPDALALPVVVKEEGFYLYPVPAAKDPTTHWHLNFADPNLFGYGEGELLAQDELQITEHPALASLGKAIQHGPHGVAGLKRLTREDGEATPVLVEGAPRRCALDTRNLYGDDFARASEASIRAATEPLRPPTRSNILALAALRPSHGAYTQEQVRRLLQTAYTGFRALVLRSRRVTLHTGFWGCGAFGGNKGLVSAVQMLAAGAAGVEQVHFWWGSTPLNSSAFDHALAVAKVLESAGTGEAMRSLASAGYRWGSANENYVPFEPPDFDLSSR